MKPTVDDLIKRYATLSTRRQTWANLWEELALYVMPNRADFVTRLTPGDKSRTQQLYDSTAIDACIKLASSLHSALMAPNAKWFELRFRQEELNDFDAVREWLEECGERMDAALNESNFNSKGNELMLDLGCFGTGNLFCEAAQSDDGTFQGLHFDSFFLGEIVIDENHEGVIDTVMRRFKLSARNAVDKWPNALMPKARDLLDTDPDKMLRFLHVIMPNAEYDTKKRLSAPEDRPIYSCYISIDDREKLEEFGYYEMPHMVPRWSKITGDSYGFSPAQCALPDIRTLNEAKRLELMAWEKSIDPPMKAQANNVVADIDLKAGGVTMLRQIAGLEPLLNMTNWSVVQVKSVEIREAIRDAFYDSVLDFPGGPNVTATEVVKRIELMQRRLAPVLGRLQAELLNPLIERVFGVMYRAGAFPELPEELPAMGDPDIDIEYVSPLARAQKAGDIEAINRWLGLLASVRESFPEMMDHADTDEIPQVLAELMGVPAKAVRGMDQVEKLRRERAEAQARMMQQQMAMQQAGNGNQPVQ